MKKLFDKNEIAFAVILIVIYVAGSSAMADVSEAIGTEYTGETIFHIAMTALLIGFIKKNGLSKHLGLCASEVSAAKMWFYIPLIAAAALPLCFGIKAQYPAPALACRTVSMLCVGFLEEIIFRGFLFKGICKSSVNRAIVISSVTFGIGHIVNLLNGYDIFRDIVQIVYAVSVGFMLVFTFYRTGSIIMCVVFHSLNNILTAFAVIDQEGSSAANMILLTVRIAIMAAYTIYIVKFIPKRDE